jgi:heme-degrading monooxygenase HmoA
MYVTITSGAATPEQAQVVGTFLDEFLPRMVRGTQAVAAYHFEQPDKGATVTLIIWPSKEAVQEYRESDLMREVAAFEASHALEATREGYELRYPPNGAE